MTHGPVLCQIKIPNTGDFQKWTNVSAPINAVTGEHSVYLTFPWRARPALRHSVFRIDAGRADSAGSHGPIEVTYA